MSGVAILLYGFAALGVLLIAGTAIDILLEEWNTPEVVNTRIDFGQLLRQKADEIRSTLPPAYGVSIAVEAMNRWHVKASAPVPGPVYVWPAEYVGAHRHDYPVRRVYEASV